MASNRTFDASRRRSLLALALLMSGRSAMAAGTVAEALQRPALPARKPAQSMLLAAALAGSRIVAVGERGLIALSDDRGRSWRQAAVPVSITLTAVCFADAKNGVAAGHGGVILATADGGEHWTVRMDGRRAADLVLAAARAGNNDAARREAERLVAEGPDKPFLDVLMPSPSRILVVGAYGMCLESSDAGANWSSWGARLDNPKALHHYAIRQRGATILVAGEAGTAYCSVDGGKTFRRLETPYKGSYFTAELPADHRMVIAGLRGNAWVSEDEGRTWSQLAAPIPASITSSLILPGGRMLFANQAGFVLEAVGERLAPLNAAPLPPLNGLAFAGENQLLALTIRGPMPIEMTHTKKAKS